MSAVLLAALLAQQPADAAVTLKRKTATWVIARTPEARARLMTPGGRVGKEIDVPARLHVRWSAVDPLPPHIGNPLVLNAEEDPVIVPFYAPGKAYEDISEEEKAHATDEALMTLELTLAERFLEVDLDFPGGSWDALASLLREKLMAAWTEQLPEILKPHVPARLDIRVATPPGYHVRYPAVQAKALSLARLRSLGLLPELIEEYEIIPSTPRKDDPDPSPSVSRRVPGRLSLRDGNRDQGVPEALQVAFFHLGGRPALPKAEDVVALFELAWKARGGPVFSRVKYHPETRTILLQATPEEIAAAQRAFDTLTGRPSRPEPSPNPFDGLQERLQKIAELLEQAASKEKSEGK